jgi:hypothetical protein
MPREILGAILLGVALAMVYGLLPGCAEIRECAPVSVTLLETDEGTYSGFTREGLVDLLSRQRDLQAGRCRLPPFVPEEGSRT